MLGMAGEDNFVKHGEKWMVLAGLLGYAVYTD